MSLQEGPPRSAMLPIGSWLDTMCSEDITDSGVRDVAAHIGQGTLDAVITPSWVLLCEAKSQVDDLLPDSWSTD